MNESEVYILAKKWFNSNHFKVVAGQPPNGTDNIPVIEIKNNLIANKGSKDSFKPDLVAINSNNIVIIECKPLYSLDDKNKLMEIVFDQQRKRNFYNEIMQRGIFKKYGYEECFDKFDKFSKSLRYCLANCSNPTPMEYVANLYLSNKYEKSVCDSSFLIPAKNQQFALN
tara:strand:+ start:2281 stop:2790 length:510 start_codon:yes stop_codon:yes gene_type:complete